MISIPERNGELVDRVLHCVGTTKPPAPPSVNDPIARPAADIVYFADGPRQGMVSVMPSGCDQWIEPDGTVYA
jgi:hypothetical protein